MTEPGGFDLLRMSSCECRLDAWDETINIRSIRVVGRQFPKLEQRILRQTELVRGSRLRTHLTDKLSSNASNVSQTRFDPFDEGLEIVLCKYPICSTRINMLIPFQQIIIVKLTGSKPADGQGL